MLRLLDPTDFEGFLTNLRSEVAEVLRVDSVRLVLESVQETEDPALDRLGEVLCVADPGFIDAYITGGRNIPVRPVCLRQTQPHSDAIYGDAAGHIRSEALMKLDLGRGRLPGMLALGAEDPHHFKSSQGTDLLVFFAGVFERSMRRWLA